LFLCNFLVIICGEMSKRAISNGMGSMKIIRSRAIGIRCP